MGAEIMTRTGCAAAVVVVVGMMMSPLPSVPHASCRPRTRSGTARLEETRWRRSDAFAPFFP